MTLELEISKLLQLLLVLMIKNLKPLYSFFSLHGLIEAGKATTPLIGPQFVLNQSDSSARPKTLPTWMKIACTWTFTPLASNPARLKSSRSCFIFMTVNSRTEAEMNFPVISWPRPVKLWWWRLIIDWERWDFYRLEIIMRRGIMVYWIWQWPWNGLMIMWWLFREIGKESLCE